MRVSVFVCKMSYSLDLDRLANDHQITRVHMERKFERQVLKLERFQRKQMNLLRSIQEQKRLVLEAQLMDEMVVCMSRLQILSDNLSSLAASVSSQVNFVENNNSNPRLDDNLDNIEHQQQQQQQQQQKFDQDQRADFQNDAELESWAHTSIDQMPSISIMPAMEYTRPAIFECRRQRSVYKKAKRRRRLRVMNACARQFYGSNFRV